MSRLHPTLYKKDTITKGKIKFEPLVFPPGGMISIYVILETWSLLVHQKLCVSNGMGSVEKKYVQKISGNIKQFIVKSSSKKT